MRFMQPLTLLLASAGLAPVIPSASESPKSDDLILIQKGTLPVIISAPHGGRMKVPGVPERLGRGIAKFQTVLDAQTAEIAEAFARDLEDELQGKPWLVVARFDRRYIDANRSAAEAYESEKAKPLYDAYHAALAEACRAVKKKFGRGLLMDIHGQGEFQEAICRGTRNGKSVALLKDRDGWSALTGKRSILGHLQRNGYKVLPSCEADAATREPAKFDGGYIIDTYGCQSGYAIDAIQLEFGTNLRDKEKGRYTQTARDLAAAVAVFYEDYLKDGK